MNYKSHINMTIEDLMARRGRCGDYPRERLDALWGGRDTLSITEMLKLNIPLGDRIEFACLTLCEARLKCFIKDCIARARSHGRDISGMDVRECGLMPPQPGRSPRPIRWADVAQSAAYEVESAETDAACNAVPFPEQKEAVAAASNAAWAWVIERLCHYAL